MHSQLRQYTCLTCLGCKMVITIGEMVEWSITTVLKTVVLRGTGGSNPSLSANKGVNQRVTRFAPFSTPKNLEIIKLHRPTLNPIGKIYSHLGTTICYWGSSIVILNTTPLLYSSYFYFFYGRFQLR